MNQTLTTSTTTKPLYFGALDGFRGVLAVCVAIFHTFWYSHINFTPFFLNGPVIIDLFFVFSGFLMYTLYRNRLSNREQAFTFLKRRFARLYPIHIFMLLVFIAFALVRVWAHKAGVSVQEPGEILPFQAGSSESFFSIFTHLTMTHSMGLSAGLTFNPPSWTISVEFFTYFVFLLVFLRFPPTKHRHFMFISLCICLIYIGLSLLKPNMDITYDLGFFRCLAGFFTGLVASWLYGIWMEKGTVLASARASTMTALEIIVLGAFVCFVIYMPGKLQFFVGPFAFVFVLVFAFDGGLVSKFMSLRIFRYLAKISYSVYMVHTIFAIFFQVVGSRLVPSIMTTGGWTGDLLLIPYLMTVIAFSHFTWRFIERPGQVWLQKANYSKLFPFSRRASS